MSTPRWLALVLAVQLVLAVATWWPEDGSAHRPRPLLALSAQDITSIALAAAPDEPGEPPKWVEVARENGRWVLASEQGYPANASAVETLAERIASLHVGQPIATRAAHHDDLGVGNDSHGRRLRVGTADGEHELFVGAAASDRVNVRVAGSDDVFVARGLSEFALDTAPSAYWTVDYVRATGDEISAIQVENARGRFRAVRGDSGWQIEGSPESPALDEAAFAEWLGRVTRLRMERPVSKDTAALDASTDRAHVGWTIQAEDQTVAGGYTIARTADDRWLAKSDGDAFVVEVTRTAAEPLLEVVLEDLVSSAEDEGAAEAAPAPDVQD